MRRESNNRNFDLPIAATFVNGDPRDMMPVHMHLCNECRRKIYKTLAEIADKDKLDKLNEKAINVKMNRDWEF